MCYFFKERKAGISSVGESSLIVLVFTLFSIMVVLLFVLHPHTILGADKPTSVISSLHVLQVLIYPPTGNYFCHL